MPHPYDEQAIQAKLDAAVKWILSQEEFHCPPEDGRKDWEPWEFDLMDRLLRGRQSLRIPVEYLLFFDGNEVQMHSKALNEHRLDGLPVEIATLAQLTDGAEVPPSIPAHHRRVVYALCPCERDVIGVPVARVCQEYLEETDHVLGALLGGSETNTKPLAALSRWALCTQWQCRRNERQPEGWTATSTPATLAPPAPAGCR